MARQKKEYIPLNAKIDADVMVRFNRYCDEVGQTKTLAVERILGAFLNEYEMGKNPAGTFKRETTKKNV